MKKYSIILIAILSLTLVTYGVFEEETIETIRPAEELPLEVVETIRPAEELPLEVVETIRPAEELLLEVVETIRPAEELPLEVVETIRPAEELPLEVVETIRPAEELPLEAIETIQLGNRLAIETIQPTEYIPLEAIETIRPAEELPLEATDAILPDNRPAIAAIQTGISGQGRTNKAEYIFNKALANASEGDKAVKNWLVGGAAGTAITAPPEYGTVSDDSAFEPKTGATTITEIPFLQIGSKVYHHIKPSAKLLLENNKVEVLYLGDEELKTAPADLKKGLAAAKGAAYTGKVNALWTIAIPGDIRYYSERIPGGSTTIMYGKVHIPKDITAMDVGGTKYITDMQTGDATVVVAKGGSATIIPTGIGNVAATIGANSDPGSESFGWKYQDNNLTEDTKITGNYKKITVTKVWKPKAAPVINISNTGTLRISAGYKSADNKGIHFIGKTEVGGKIKITYDITGSDVIKYVGAPFYRVDENSEWHFRTHPYDNDQRVEAGFYTKVKSDKFKGYLDLAFVAYKKAAE